MGQVASLVLGNRLTKLGMDEAREATRGRFTDAELNHMYALFHGACDRGGRMGQVEFKAYVESLDIYPQAGHDETYQQLFRAFDRQGRGAISFQQFLEYHLALKFGTDPDLRPLLCDVLFALYDTKHDGHIDRDELLEVITRNARWIGVSVEEDDVDPVIERIMQLADLDRDGHVSMDDLQTAAAGRREVLEILLTAA